MTSQDLVTTGVRAFAPGDWFAVLGADTAVFLPAAQRDRVAALWDSVDSGAGFSEVLDALLASGLSSLPAFVVLGEDGGRVLVRGDAVVRATAAGEEVRVACDQAATWAEHVFEDPAALSIELDGSAEPADLSITTGLVRVSRVVWREGGTDEADVRDVPDEVTALLVDPGTEDSTGLESAAVAEPEPVADPEPVVAPEPVAEPEPVVAPEPVAEPEPVAAPEPVVRPEPVVEPEPEPQPDPLAHDGHTQYGARDNEPDRPLIGLPGQPPPPSVVSKPVARLVVSSGQIVEVDRVVLVGRAPEARRFSSQEQPVLLTVPSPNQEISSTHLEIRPGAGADHGSAVVTDLGSTNGTVLVQPGLPPEDLQPGIAVQLIPGAILDLADGVTIQITKA